MYFVEWKYINFDQDFTLSYSHGSNYQYSSTVSDKGLVPARQRAIFYWCMYASLSLSKLMAMNISWVYILIYLKHIIWRSASHKLTHWGRVTHICVDNLTIIVSDNGLSPGRRQAIIWTNVGILLIETLGTNFSEILIEIITFSVKKMHLKMSSGKWRPFCLGLNVLKNPFYKWSYTGQLCVISQPSGGYDKLSQ